MQPFLWQHHTILKQLHDIFNQLTALQQEFEKYLPRKSVWRRGVFRIGNSSTAVKSAVPPHKDLWKICLWF